MDPKGLEVIEMMNTTINFIGAGHLGKTIGKLFVQHKIGKILGIFNSSYDSAKEAVLFMGQGTAFSSLEELPAADITFITTPDDLIESLCSKLVSVGHLKEKSIVLHCSGALSSTVLNTAKSKHCFVASVHPVRSFADPISSVKHYRGTFCSLEGDLEATEKLKNMFEEIGSITYFINGQKKSIYHAAGAFASNYIATLSKMALDCLKEAGIPDDVAFELTMNLMSDTLNNLKETQSSEKALTGPLKRGDLKTIEKHIAVLEDTNKMMSHLYKTLALATLELTALPKEKREELKSLLSS